MTLDQHENSFLLFICIILFLCELSLTFLEIISPTSAFYIPAFTIIIPPKTTIMCSNFTKLSRKSYLSSSLDKISRANVASK